MQSKSRSKGAGLEQIRHGKRRAVAERPATRGCPAKRLQSAAAAAAAAAAATAAAAAAAAAATAAAAAAAEEEKEKKEELG
jgi:hypothetical protein